MEPREFFRIGAIPAALWGEPSDGVVIAVHGRLSHKTDMPIGLFARWAAAHGWQTLSFDLPEHGARKGEDTLCQAETCVPELRAVLACARARWRRVGLFGNSMGAYFALLAYRAEPLERAWFLSPVVDMAALVDGMLRACDATPAQLKEKQTLVAPWGQALYWPDYRYIQAHPVDSWPVPTRILCGSADDCNGKDAIAAFADRFSCELTVMEGGEHWFHTEQQLRFLTDWLEEG